MFRYRLAALALRAFSCNTATEGLYRKIGNLLGSRRRNDLPLFYIDRAKWLIDTWSACRTKVDHRLSIIELGTGWLHFYGTLLRIREPLDVQFFDVWDNRQFDAFKRAFQSIQNIPDVFRTLSFPDALVSKAVLASIQNAADWREVYQHLDGRYLIDPSGELKNVPSEAHDLLFSMDVLEHVNKDNAKECVADYFRVLKPGGLSIHQVGIDDHLGHYDKSASPKQYLVYSDRMWKRRYQNTVQYFNRISVSEFRKLFKAAGFEEVKVEIMRSAAALDGLKIAPEFSDLPQEDLEAVRVNFVHRKPR